MQGQGTSILLCYENENIQNWEEKSSTNYTNDAKVWHRFQLESSKFKNLHFPLFQFSLFIIILGINVLS